MAPSFLLTNGITLAIALAVVGLVFAFILIRQVVGSDAGNAKMHEIASAIQQGAQPSSPPTRQHRQALRWWPVPQAS